MANPEPWLREVARKTASDHRRRAFRRTEIPWADPERMVLREAADPEREHAAEVRLGEALAQLDPNRREVLLYSDLADLSVSDLAVLLDCDRKTARKRLLAARQRLGRLLTDPGIGIGAGADLAESVDEEVPLFDPQRVALNPATSSAPSRELQVVAQGPSFAAGVVGRVFMTVWRRAALEEIETMAAAAARVYHATGGKFAYLTLVEARCPPPPFSSRMRLAQIVREARSYLCSYATVLSGGPSAFVVPVMNVAFLLANPDFPVRFFRSELEATRWTVDRTGFDLSPTDLTRALAALRLGPSTVQRHGPTPRVGSQP